jgi:hypothetical protein
VFTAAREFLQYLITSLMPVIVIDLFEVIEIEHHTAK